MKHIIIEAECVKYGEIGRKYAGIPAGGSFFWRLGMAHVELLCMCMK